MSDSTSKMFKSMGTKTALLMINRTRPSKLPKKEIAKDLGPLDKCLFALCILEEADIIEATAEDILTTIEWYFDIPFGKGIKSVTNSLRKAKDKIHNPIKKDGIIHYKISSIGRNRIINIKNEEEILFISGEKDLTDNIKIIKTLKQLKGEIMIIDRYYGLGTIEILKELGNRKIRFLTYEKAANEDEGKLESRFSKLKTEFKKIEIHTYPNWKKEIHDRYILSDNFFVIIGHGLNNIGSKESFLILIKTEKTQNIVKKLKRLFDSRWIKSQNLR